jgi:hypothetical protein
MLVVVRHVVLHGHDEGRSPYELQLFLQVERHSGELAPETGTGTKDKCIARFEVINVEGEWIAKRSDIATERMEPVNSSV